MATATGTRALKREMYLTDGDALIYVVDIPKPGQAVVENAMTGRTDYVSTEHLDGWRVVIPEGRDA
jgi:hypothetical protein